jgi:hypothetical protein
MICGAAKEAWLQESKASTANKLARATVPVHFFLASLAAVGCATVQLEDI